MALKIGRLKSAPDSHAPPRKTPKPSPSLAPFSMLQLVAQRSCQDARDKCKQEPELYPTLHTMNCDSSLESTEQTYLCSHPVTLGQDRDLLARRQ